MSSKTSISLLFILFLLSGCSHSKNIQGVWLDDNAGIQVIVTGQIIKFNDIVTFSEKELRITHSKGDTLFWEESFLSNRIQFDFIVFKMEARNMAQIIFNPQSELKDLELKRIK